MYSKGERQFDYEGKKVIWSFDRCGSGVNVICRHSIFRFIHRSNGIVGKCVADIVGVRNANKRIDDFFREMSISF
jgi:hypothetical protein